MVNTMVTAFLVLVAVITVSDSQFTGCLTNVGCGGLNRGYCNAAPGALTGTCVCYRGFYLNPVNPTLCQDINECIVYPCGRNSGRVCVNTIGSYYCRNVAGYNLPNWFYYSYLSELLD